jgi:hypothetical protein
MTRSRECPECGTRWSGHTGPCCHSCGTEKFPHAETYDCIAYDNTERAEGHSVQLKDFEHARKYIGGYIQVVARHGDKVFLADEDGLCKGCGFNAEASLAAGLDLVGVVLEAPVKILG